jgi:anti-sigma-K factor RskA
MARFDSLPADQKAVLQLLLKQGKSYDDLAGLLRTTPEQVRERALLALDALGPADGHDLDDDQVDDLGDYLLGQQSASARARTRQLLESSAPARNVARTIAGELRPLAGDALPDVPAEPAEADEAFRALDARKRARTEQAKKSRTGGAVLLAGAGLLLALVVLLLTGVIGGGDDDEDGERAATTTQAATTGQPRLVAQVNLQPPEGSQSEALGVVQILEQGGQRAIAVVGQGLPESRRYAVWLTGGEGRPALLGFAPPVQGSGETRGQLQALASFPEDAEGKTDILLTRETVDRPTQPGTVVLRGDLDQPQGQQGGSTGGTGAAGATG